MILNHLHLHLDAEQIEVSFDDLLWCISCFYSDDPGARLHEAPETLTLDVLWRVAHYLGADLDVQLVPVEA